MTDLVVAGGTVVTASGSFPADVAIADGRIEAIAPDLANRYRNVEIMNARGMLVLPGAVDTPMLWDNPNIRSGVESINRADVGRPEDIAAVIAFLASDDAAFVQGAAVRADGGRLDRL